METISLFFKNNSFSKKALRQGFSLVDLYTLAEYFCAQSACAHSMREVGYFAHSRFRIADIVRSRVRADRFFRLNNLSV